MERQSTNLVKVFIWRAVASHAGNGEIGTVDAEGLPMVRLRVALHASSTSRARDFLDALRYIALGTRCDPGCLSASAWVDPDSRVHYVEEWSTEPEMRWRVRSASFVSLLAVVESASNPEVHFDFVSETRGLEYVAEARNDTAN